MAKSARENINWTTGLIVKTFGLNREMERFPLLDAWLDVENDLSEDDVKFLEHRREQLKRNVRSWNEETLKMRFIALILDRADYDMGAFQGVFETEMAAVVQNHPLKVITDFAVARVTEDLIENPYFYFHEYKPKVKKSKDPLAQVLLAMLISQELNQDEKPIYGCHVIGEDWCFMVLKDKTYSMSDELDATKSDDLQKILLVLRKFKHILLTELAA